jgi:hypothetical protein
MFVILPNPIREVQHTPLPFQNAACSIYECEKLKQGLGTHVKKIDI